MDEKTVRDLGKDAAAQHEVADVDIMQLFDARAAMYGMLARLFREELTFEDLQQLKGMQFPVGTCNVSIDQGFHDLFDYLKTAWQGSVTELAIDYARTFIGSGTSGYSAAYLYESVYTSERRLLAREARGEVLQFYRNNGLKKGKWNDMEDHLALELEFMQVLSLRTRDALVEGDEDAALNLIRTQRDFARLHLNNWLPMMSGDAQRFAETKFYRGAAMLVLGYCADDEKLLAEILENAPEAPVDIVLEEADVA